MTTDAEKLAVMEGAIKHGKKVECRNLCRAASLWEPVNGPRWNWAEFDYRLAPERKKAKVWVNVFRDLSGAIYPSEDIARQNFAYSQIRKCFSAIAVPIEFEYEEGYGLEERA